MAVDVASPLFGSRRIGCAVGLVALCLMAGCDDADRARVKATTQANYDRATGKLAEITYDKNKNGRIDTWVKMDGSRPIYAEIDSDEDGQIDRWEEYGPDGKLTLARISRAKNGKPDQVIYMNAAGQVDRIDYLEVSDVTGKEGVVRREFFERDQRVRAEEDADGDGLMDRWEHYDASGAQIAVEFDTIKPYSGKPNRRMNYSPTGALLSIETDPDGAGGYLKKTIPGKKKE